MHDPAWVVSIFQNDDSSAYYDKTIADVWIGSLNEMACSHSRNLGKANILSRYSQGSVRVDPSFKYRDIDVKISAASLPNNGTVVVILSNPVKSISNNLTTITYGLENDGNHKIEFKVASADADKFLGYIQNASRDYFREIAANVPFEESDQAYSQLSRLSSCSCNEITDANRIKYFQWLAGERWTNTDQEDILIKLLQNVSNRSELYNSFYKDRDLLVDLMLSCDSDNRQIFVNEITRLCNESWNNVSPKGRIWVGRAPAVSGKTYSGQEYITAVDKVGSSGVKAINYIGRFASLPFNWGSVQELNRIGEFTCNLLDPIELLTADGTTSVVPLLYPVNTSEEKGNSEVIGQLTGTLNYIGVLSSVRILTRGASLLPKGVAFTELTKTGFDYVIDNPSVRDNLNKSENGKTFLRYWEIASVAIDLGTIGADVLEGLAKHGPEASKLLRESGNADAAKHVDELAVEAASLVKGVGKAFDDALAALKKNTSLQDHIFIGDYRKVTGCHYRGGVDGVNVRFANNAVPEANSLGVLKGDIEMRRPLLDVQGNVTGYKWELKPTRDGPQTFFPQTWSKDEVLEQCASALANPKKALVPGKSRMYTAESNSGVFMKWFEDDAGNVVSIFPEFY